MTAVADLLQFNGLISTIGGDIVASIKHYHECLPLDISIDKNFEPKCIEQLKLPCIMQT
jgi:hypothetical protein